MLSPLRCPVCHQPLEKQAGSYSCSAGHSFDIAKEGHVNLLLAHKKSSKLPGDSKEMLLARRRFLEQGFYAPLVSALSEISRLHVGRGAHILDVGCGEGYFTAGVREASEDVAECWGLDVSKAAVQLAARRYKHCQFAVASSQELPFLSHAFSFVFNINSPVNGDEIIRVLNDEGIYVRVSPAPNHLWELKKLIYQNPQPHDQDPLAIAGLQHAGRDTVSFALTVERAFIFDLLLMTPYYWHATKQQQEAIKALSRLVTPAGFHIDVYRKSV